MATPKGTGSAEIPSPPKRPGQLRIAVIGGGIAGAAAALAFSRLPDVQVKVYERSPAIREVGAQIAVMVTAIKILHRLLSPAAFEELQQNLYRGEGTDGIHHRHWASGEILATNISPGTPRYMQEGRTSRVVLHRILMKEVPENTVQYGHEVVRVQPRQIGANDNDVLLHFSDGTTREADLVVTADGLYSVGGPTVLLAKSWNAIVTDKYHDFSEN